MALPTGYYVYEFKYRGRPSNSLTPPDFYVIIAAPATDAFGNLTTAYLGPLTPAAAEALGASPIGAALTVVNGIQPIMTTLAAALAAYQAAVVANPGVTPPVLALVQPTGIYVEEFLYRGQPAGGAASDWSVLLAQSATDAFGNLTTAYLGPLTPAKAASLTGLTLTTAIAGIVAAVQLQINSLNAATAAL